MSANTCSAILSWRNDAPEHVCGLPAPYVTKDERFYCHGHAEYEELTAESRELWRRTNGGFPPGAGSGRIEVERTTK